jgi:hypothetical protein
LPNADPNCHPRTGTRGPARASPHREGQRPARLPRAPPGPGPAAALAHLSHRLPNAGSRSRSIARSVPGRTGKGNPYLQAALGAAAASAARTDTFLGERYRRIARRRGKLKALVTVARSILVIIWHLLANRATRYRDLGPGHYASRIDKEKKTRNHIRQLEALGYAVTLAPAA